MDRLFGVLLVSLYAVFVAANPILARIGYDSGADPVTFLFCRFIIALPVMLLIMKTRGLSIPRGKLLVSLMLMGVIATGTILCFFIAIRFAPVNLLIIIFYMFPTMVTLLSSVFLKLPITGTKVVALILTFAGIMLAIGVDSGGYILGIVLAVVTAILHSIYLTFGSLSIKRAGSFSASTVIIIPSVVIFGILLCIQGPQWPQNSNGWFAIIASSLISTLLARIFLFEGLRRIDTANVAIICSFEVVVTVTLAFFILGEVVTFIKICGMCMVILAIIILARNEYHTSPVKLDPSITR